MDDSDNAFSSPYPLNHRFERSSLKNKFSLNASISEFQALPQKNIEAPEGNTDVQQSRKKPLAKSKLASKRTDSRYLKNRKYNNSHTKAPNLDKPPTLPPQQVDLQIQKIDHT